MSSEVTWAAKNRWAWLPINMNDSDAVVNLKLAYNSQIL
jgi:hypothetical protein